MSLVEILNDENNNKRSPESVASVIIEKVFQDHHLNPAYQQPCVDSVSVWLVAKASGDVFDTDDLITKYTIPLFIHIKEAGGAGRENLIMDDFKKAVNNTVVKAKTRAAQTARDGHS